MGELDQESTAQIEGLADSLRAGFIDAGMAYDPQFAPQIVSNDAQAHTNVLAMLKEQLAHCESFDFAVAFITESGVQTLIQLLLALRDRGTPGRIVTTTFNNFNKPEALRKLLEFPNLSVRIYEGSMHTKGYIFRRRDVNALVIGSANLTQTALCLNKEWNVLLHARAEGSLFRAASREFEKLWCAEETVPLTQSWVDAYEAFRASLYDGAAPPQVHRAFVSMQSGASERQSYEAAPVHHLRPSGNFAPTKDVPATTGWLPAAVPASVVSPNRMQREALESLARLHQEGVPRALLVSATGTGKTYLSAFDIKAARPRRALFVAHRERILKASLASFKRVLGNAYAYGMYHPGEGQPERGCLFAMVESLTRHLDEFDPRAFDYIVIDETHRAGAAGYRRILDYFKPDFVLGMTATPQRTDGYDIFELYNHVIAFQITLRDALSEEMLAPFHYYGIADLSIEGTEQDDVSLFSHLTSEERISHVIRKIEDYSVSKNDRRGLVFCSRNAEARLLSEAFNSRGYRTQALSGSDSDAVRDYAIKELEAGNLQYLFSVDIFNEGVDIPSVNQIIMLRPTESVIVFVQQLGRGLRKAPGKESVLVLDFIGNYQNNYLIPIALSGDRSFDKDNLRRFVKEGSTVIPGCSTVSFDRVSEARVFEKIDAARFGTTMLIRQEYRNLRMMLGRTPNLADFDAQGMIDPLIIFEKFGSYHAFLSKYEPTYSTCFSDAQEQMLRYISQKLANGKRAGELRVLRQLVLEKETFGQASPGDEGSSQVYHSIAAMLTNRFTLHGQRKSFSKAVFVECREGGFCRSASFEEALHDESFRNQVLELIDFGLARNTRSYAATYADTSFVLYEKYALEDVCRLLNWEDNAVPLNVGGYKYDEGTNTFPVFINYNKAPDISDTIKYEDRFVSDRELIAISKQPRTMDSPEIVRLRNIDKNGVQPYLFVRKNKDDADGGKEFYFLGKMYPMQRYRPFVMPNTNKAAVEIAYRLDVPVRPDIYDYLTSEID